MSLGFEASSAPSAQVAYLRTLPAIRDRCSRVHDLATRSKLEYFDYHPEKEAEVVDFCCEIIKRDFGTDYDKAWHTFQTRDRRPRVQPLIDSWRASTPAPSDLEIAKRLIDLFLVSVLLDAGAGNEWKYTEKDTGDSFARSEGLAVASLDMFLQGFFSSDPAEPFKVDGEFKTTIPAAGLGKITTENVSAAMQVSATNPMSGIEGRTGLLSNLAEALQSQPEYFGDCARPGAMLDFLKSQSRVDNGRTKFHVSALFGLLIEGLSSIWPSGRSNLGGVALGDVWPCAALAQNPKRKESSIPENVKFSPSAKVKSATAVGNDLVPFHKLTQWITYSLVEPIEKVLGWEVEGLQDMTGLPEYRNGGLLVDFGVLELRHATVSSYHTGSSNVPKLPPSHPAIIEWRAMTVIELDRIADGIRKKVDYPLKLAQVLESATWKGGREIAKRKRPDTGGPPIEIESDGTVF
ncbi:hypothetical protein FRB99_003765 [Tulasnella sp. 403]|nr:hypothetical protein FRB99_003765 [Tulasnella sp. 403]